MKKSNLLKTLAVLSVCCVGGGVLALDGFNVGVAATTLETTDMLVMDGASIRFQQKGETAETSTAGIRFETRIKKADWTDAGITEIGMVFLPVSEGTVTEETYSVDTAKAWTEVVYGGDENRDGRFSVTEQNVDYYALRAYIYEIPVSDYGTAIQARAYAIADGVTYYTTDICTRSIASVASKALRDTITAEEATDDYIYEISEGVWSPYSETERTSLQGYLVNAEAPTISVPTDLKLKYHVGDTVSLESITATDWLGEVLEVNYEVTTGGNPVTVVNNGFEVTEETDYTATITTTDADGRTASETVTFYVYQENEFAFFNTAATVSQEVITGGGLTAEYSTAYAKEGEGSLKIGTDGGTTIGLKFTDTANVDWDNVNGLTFYMYNPTDYEYRISVAGFTTASGAGLSGSLRINAWAKPGEWTKVAVSADNIVTTLNGEGNLLGILIEYYYNQDSAAWSGMELYLDAFTIDEEYSWEQTLLGSTSGSILAKTGLEEITVNNEKKTATYMKLNTTYMRPYAAFAGLSGVDLTGKKVTFKAYNSLSNEIKFKWTKNSAVDGSTKTAIKDMYIGAGETEEVTIFGNELDEANPYLGLYIDCDYNGGNNDTTKAWWPNGGLYFYDFVVEDGTYETQSEDYQWAVATGNSNAMTSVNTNSDYLYVDGVNFTAENNKYSLAVKRPHGNSPSISLTKSIAIDWTNIYCVKFRIYNPADATINLAINTSEDEWTTSTRLQVVACTGKAWTTVVLDTSAWTASTSFGFVPRSADNENSTSSAGWTAWCTTGFYVDGFETGDEATLNDYLWSVAVNGTGSAPSQNTDKAYVVDGEYSLLFKPTGTWNCAILVNTNISWSQVTALKFKVYNPNNYDLYFEVGNRTSNASASGYFDSTTEGVGFTVSAYNAENPWQEITIDLTNVTWSDGEYLCIRTNQSANSDVTGDDGWTAVQANGLYFDAFEVVYAS